MAMGFRKIIEREASRRRWSAYRVAQEAGLPIRTVQRYMAGDSDLHGESVAAICEALGLELRPKEPQRKGAPLARRGKRKQATSRKGKR